MQCDGCWVHLSRTQVERSLRVCPVCQRHFPVPAAERIAQLLDAATFEEWAADLRSADPLGFVDGGPYPGRLRAEQERTGLTEAAVVGQGALRGHRLVLGLTDAAFLGGSMGSVVGEKLTRAIEGATRRRLPLVLLFGSGGARMHEGILSLMQMAKVAAALARHRSCGGLYLSILTHPTIGGVVGCAALADLILAEPRALIGFVGPRVLAQTARLRLPEGVQTSESLLAHGFLDRIVPRRDLRDLLGRLLDYLAPAPAGRPGPRPGPGPAAGGAGPEAPAR